MPVFGRILTRCNMSRETKAEIEAKYERLQEDWSQLLREKDALIRDKTAVIELREEMKLERDSLQRTIHEVTAIPAIEAQNAIFLKDRVLGALKHLGVTKGAAIDDRRAMRDELHTVTRLVESVAESIDNAGLRRVLLSECSRLRRKLRQEWMR